MLRDYSQNKIDLEARKIEIIQRTAPRPDFGIYAKGNDQDDTANRAAQLLKDPLIQRLTAEITAVDYARLLCKSGAVKHGDKMLKLIVLVYERGTHTIVGAAMKCGIRSPHWAGRLIGRYLDLINSYYTN
jgi:hypothetical protein